MPSKNISDISDWTLFVARSKVQLLVILMNCFIVYCFNPHKTGLVQKHYILRYNNIIAGLKNYLNNAPAHTHSKIQITNHFQLLII